MEAPLAGEDEQGQVVDLRLTPEFSTPGERIKSGLDNEQVISTTEDLYKLLTEGLSLSPDEAANVVSRLLGRIAEGSQRQRGPMYKSRQDEQA